MNIVALGSIRMVTPLSSMISSNLPFSSAYSSV